MEQPSVFERHSTVLVVALIVLIVVSHTMAYRDEVSQTRYVDKPHSLCRLPDVDEEYRLIIQHRVTDGSLIEECVIVPRNQEESPATTMQRLLKRKRQI